MRIIKHLRSDWFRYGFETLAVVVGILVAFALENWGEEREIRREELKILESLQSEFQSNNSILAIQIANHEKITLAIRKLEKFCAPNPKAMAFDSLDELMGLILWIPKYVPNMGTVNSVIFSGNMALIRNDDLKYNLVNWTSALERYNYSADVIYNTVKNDLTPLIARHYPIRNIQIKISLSRLSQSKFSNEYNKLLSNIEFENYLEIRRLDSEIILERALAIQELQAEILQIIQTGLSSSN